MNNKFKIGDKLVVVLSTAKPVPVDKHFEIVEILNHGIYKVDGGYLLSVVNEHPMFDGIGVILKLVQPEVEIEEELVSDYGDLMTIKEFEEAVEGGAFTNDDGSARYSDGVHVFGGAYIYDLDQSHSHIVWYNK